VAAVVGVRATLVGAALIGAAVTLGAYFLPGMTDIEHGGTGDPGLGDVTAVVPS